MSDTRIIRREGAIAKARLAINDGAAQDEIVQFLRQHHLNKIDSLIALHHLYEVDLNEAKRIVHESPAWRDSKLADEQLHQELLVFADSLSDERRRIAG